MSKDELARRITSKTTTYFAEKGQPYLLSRIPPDLAADDLNYREIVGDQTLKDFVEGLSGIKIVRHPTQKAKIGVIPAHAAFSYKTESNETLGLAPADKPRMKRSPQPNALTSLLQSLAHLEPEELDSVHIPVRVMIRLAGIK